MDPRHLPDPADFRHRSDVQLRFNDVDILGHVNNTVYFSFYDTGKALYFRDVRSDRFSWRDVDTVIANVDCAYVDSIVFGEEIEVLTRCEAIHEKSFKMLQILREKYTGKIKSACETVMVSFDPATKKSCEVPRMWREAFEKYEGRDLSELPGHK